MELHDTLDNPQEDRFVYREASIGQRFGNLLIDYSVIIGVIFIPAAVLSEIAYGSSWAVGQEVIWGSSFVICRFVYYLLFESISRGRTLGTLITGTRVVDAMDKRPDFSACLLRSVVRTIPLEGLALLLNNADQKKALHDRLSNTRVIGNLKFFPTKVE